MNPSKCGRIEIGLESGLIFCASGNKFMPSRTNDGDIAVQWALDGLGIVMRAEWDIAKHLNSGRLKQVLKNYRTPEADIYAVYPQRHKLARRVRVFVDFLNKSFAGPEA